MFRLTLAAILSTGGLVGAAAAQDTTSPLATVQSLYGERTAPTTELSNYFAPDIAEALQADLALRQPTVSTDYRFDLPSRPSGDLVFSEVESADGAQVNVEFGGGSVEVTLCRRGDGQWRVMEMRDPEGFWATRQYLELQRGHVPCE